MKAASVTLAILAAPGGAVVLSAELYRHHRSQAHDEHHLRGRAKHSAKHLPIRGACVDEPIDWKSNSSSTCQDYKTFDWCTKDGDYGKNWGRADGTFADWRGKGGYSAAQACCACGGGTKVDILLAPAGATSCPEGAPVSDADMCQAAATNMEVEFFSADKWPEGHPSGCHSDEQGSSVWFNGDENAKNNGQFSLVCMRKSEVGTEEANAAEIKYNDKPNATKAKDDDDDDDKDDKDDDDGKDDDQNDDDKVDSTGLMNADKETFTKLMAAVDRTHDVLTKNMRELVAVRQRLQGLDVASGDIEEGMEGVLNETKSGAMAGLIGDMWKEMRMFNTPFYEEQLHEKLEQLVKDQDALKAKAADADKALTDFKHEKGLA